MNLKSLLILCFKGLGLMGGLVLSNSLEKKNSKAELIAEDIPELHDNPYQELINMMPHARGGLSELDSIFNCKIATLCSWYLPGPCKISLIAH